MSNLLKIGLVAVLTLAGCKEATGPVATAFVGTYRLESFNGAVLPYTLLIDAAVTVEVLNGAIALDGDFGYVMNQNCG